MRRDLLSWKNRKPVAKGLKNFYRAVNADEAEKALTAFEERERGQKHTTTARSGAGNGPGLFPSSPSGPTCAQ